MQKALHTVPPRNGSGVAAPLSAQSRRIGRIDPVFTSAEALDAAYAGHRCEVVRANGSSRVLETHRWARDASPSDLALFVDPCRASTLDVGCGPGRLTGALTSRAMEVLGVDISPEAVRQTRLRGALAVCQDVFAELPRSPIWQHVLLADGNIGLGGNPVRLLTRIARLLDSQGTVLVELTGPGELSIHDVRLRVGDRTTRSFSWATVGTAAIGEVAAAAGLVVAEVRSMSNRHAATLRHQPATSPIARQQTGPR